MRSDERDSVGGVASQLTAPQLVNIITFLTIWEEGYCSRRNMLSPVRIRGTAPNLHHIGCRRKRNTLEHNLPADDFTLLNTLGLLQPAPEC